MQVKQDDSVDCLFFFFQAEDGIRDRLVTGVQACALPICRLDQQKLDEYLNSVREVEQRIESAGKRGELQGWRPTLAKPDIPRPRDGYPQDIVEHMRLMSDLLVLAFQTDTTRICTLKLNNDHGTLRFPHLGVDYMIHHRSEERRVGTECRSRASPSR